MPEETVLPWSGEGRPPVGQKIEMKHKRATESWAGPGFREVTIVAMGLELFLVTYGDDTDENCGVLKDYEFRPVRTPEQIEKEMRDMAISELKAIFDSCSDKLMPTSNKYLETLFGAIHDAGWRKPVQP